MPKFYFHIRHGDVVKQDPEGSELASIEEARQEAVLAARELLAERLLRGQPVNDDVFEIADEGGIVVDTVAFRSVLGSTP